MRLLTLLAMAALVGFSATEARAAEAGNRAGLLRGQGQGARQELTALRQAVHELIQAAKAGDQAAVTAAAAKVKAAWQALPQDLRDRIRERIQERRQGAAHANRAGLGGPAPLAL